jgi:hypothetical protein
MEKSSVSFVKKYLPWEIFVGSKGKCFKDIFCSFGAGVVEETPDTFFFTGFAGDAFVFFEEALAIYKKRG